MNMKTAVAAVCLALLCSAAIVCISDDSDIDASAMDTITVRNGQELTDAIRNTYAMNGDTPVPMPKNIVVADGVGTIDIDDSLVVTGKYYVSQYFFGTFNGNGCTINADVSGWKCLIDEIRGSSTLKNFHITVDRGVFTVACGAKDATVLLEDIVLDRYVTCSNNDSAFMSQMWGASDVTFRNCVNNADYVIETYAGVFLGGYPMESSVALTFDGCINNGHISGDKVYMFVGNDAHRGGAITVTNCLNNGSFTGNDAKPFADNNSAGKYADLNSAYAYLGGFTSTSLAETSSYDSSTGAVTIDNMADGRTYEIIMTAYARSAEGNTSGMFVTVPYEAGQTKVGWFVDKFTAVSKYNLLLEDFPAGYDYPYQKVVYNDEVFYVFDLGDTYEWSMDSKPKVTFKAYNADGSFAGIGSSSGDLSAPVGVPTYTVNIPRSNCYTISTVSGGNVVRSGESFSFTVVPAEGYRITTVSVYTTGEPTPITPTEGIYTFIVNSNATIAVEYEQIGYFIFYDLTNVAADDAQSMVMRGDSLRITLVPNSGYKLGVITVTDGSETYQVSGNTVFISSVSNNIIISCDGTPVTDASDEDDDDDPMIPGQPVQPKSSENNTTTVVACAAAAVAAAMIAAFLLIDGRKP